MGRELDVRVAKAAGRDANSWIPAYSTNIKAAWELDGEGWKWQFDETRRGFLDVIVWTEHGWFDAEVRFADVQSKAEAYARGRCLVWLKAKEDDDDRE